MEGGVYTVKRGIVVVVFLLVIAGLTTVFAVLQGSSTITSPSSDNAVLNGSYPFTVTFNGTANITIYWHNGTSNAINTSTNESSPYTYTFNTLTQEDEFQFYNLSILLINNTNASDNETIWRYNLTVDNNAPTASLNAPTSFIRGTYNITGYANDTTFQNYTISIYNSSSALRHQTVSVTAVNGTLHTWNSNNGTFSDGNYTVFLTVIDSLGRTSQENYTAYVDNTALGLDYVENSDGEAESNLSIGSGLDVPETITLFFNFTNNTNPGEVSVFLIHNNVCSNLANPSPVAYGNGDYNVTCAVNKSVLSGIDSSDGSYNLTFNATDGRDMVIANYTLNWDFERPSVQFSWWLTQQWNDTTNTSSNITLMDYHDLISNPDIFFSPNDTTVRFAINATDNLGVANVSVNLTNFNISTCTGILQLAYNATSGLWEGSCDLGTFNETNITMWNGGEAVPVFSPQGGAAVAVFDSYGNSLPALYNRSNTSATNPCPLGPPNNDCIPLNVPLVIHDFGAPEMPDDEDCLRFGPATTDFNLIPDMSVTNLIIEIEVNLSCDENDTSLPATFLRMVRFNFTSIDLSSPAIGSKLSALPEAISITPAPTDSWGSARIYVNSTLFAELDSTTNITLYHLPFLTQPAVIADASANGSITVCSWSAGPDANFNGETTGNLTFTVGGFSGYNVSDNESPIVTINEPLNQSNSTTSTTVVNVTVNGTGTSVSAINISLDGTIIARYDNQTGYNSANCTPRGASGELFDCYFTTSANDSNHTLLVQAWDYGGTQPGNSAHSSVWFVIDTTSPTMVVLVAPSANSYTTATYELSGTTSDSSGVSRVAITINGSEVGNATLNSTSWNYTVSGSDAAVHNITITAYDTYGNTNSSTILNVTLDGSAPALNVTNPTSNSTQTTPYSVNGTVNETGSGLTAVMIYVNNAYVGNATVSGGSWNYTLTPNDGDTQNLTVVALDSVGNNQSVTVLNVTINDSTAPSVTATSPSGEQSSSTTSVTLSATTDENATCHYATSNVAYASMTGVMNGNGTTHTASVSVSSGHSYTYYVRCRDSANNTMNSSTTITFSVASSSSSSGGGGGYYSVAGLSNSPTTVSLSIYGYYSFLGLDKETHKVTIPELGADYAIIRFQSEPVDVKMKVGESKNVDITGDGVADVYVELLTVGVQSVRMKLGKPQTSSPSTETGSTDTEGTTAETTTGTTATTMSNATTTGNETTTPATTTPKTNTTGAETTEAATKHSHTWLWLLLALVLILVVFIIWAVHSDRISVER